MYLRKGIKNSYISVITPTLNSEKCIEDCLLSVIKQDYVLKEHWIIDGGSTDNTLKIVISYTEKYNHIKYLSEKDGGIFDAMNKGIIKSHGQWLYFLGSDDVLSDNKVFSDLFSLPGIFFWDVIYGNVIFKISKVIYDGRFDNDKLIKKNICHQAIIFKRSLFNKIGNYDLRYKDLADYVFNLKWFTNYLIKKKYTNRIIAIYNENGNAFNSTDEKFALDKDSLVKKHFYWHFKFKSIKRFFFTNVRQK
jgi:glycosyltransferase involved in cell wall biosynthesis